VIGFPLLSRISSPSRNSKGVRATEMSASILLDWLVLVY
jgi:hypothetical protein